MDLAPMDFARNYVVNTIAPPIGLLTVCILGAFLVYKGFYGDAYYKTPERLSTLAPAGGTEVIYNEDMSYTVINADRVDVWTGKETFHR